DKPQYGLSSQTTRGWSSFHDAMRAYQRQPYKFAGVGYLMTGAHGLVAVDLDHCVKDGEIAPWAAEVVAKLDSYTEVSPSGNGLRIMLEGEIERDWTNHERGIEVYGGLDARFVTITGAKVEGSSPRVRKPRPGAMDEITARYRKAKTSAQVQDLHLPPLLGDDELPDLDDIDLPPHAKNFLVDGPGPADDRSRLMFATAIALRQSGLSHQQILSIMEANEHFMEAAMDHRKQDYDKTLRYLWDHHCKAGVARAEELRQLDLAQFDDMDLSEGVQDEQEGAAMRDSTPDRGQSVADDFEALEDDFSDLLSAPPPKPVKLPRFTPLPAATFMQRKPGSWIIKGVLPKAGLVLVYGDSGAGKTFLVLDLVGAVARGADWREHKVKRGRVVYVVAEGASGFQKRLAAYCQFNGIDPEDLDLLVIPDVPNLIDKGHMKELIPALKKAGPVAVVVIDTYARAMAGANENDAKDTGQAVAHCDLIHRTTGALVMLVHHSGKDGSKGARGSGALRAAADAELEVVQLRDYRVATVTKMKDGEDGKEYAFKLQEVVLGQDDEGDPITSCITEARATQPRHLVVQRRPLTERQQMVMALLQDAQDLTGEGLHFAVLKQQAVERIPFDGNSHRDNRGRDVTRAIESLVDGQ